MAALAVMMLAGCKKDKPTLNLSDSDDTGCKYNTDEGFSEDFPSYDYEWSVSGDQLRHVTYEQGVPITRTYTVTEISSTSMEREEEVATYTLTKI